MSVPKKLGGPTVLGSSRRIPSSPHWVPNVISDPTFYDLEKKLRIRKSILDTELDRILSELKEIEKALKGFDNDK